METTTKLDQTKEIKTVMWEERSTCPFLEKAIKTDIQVLEHTLVKPVT